MATRTKAQLQERVEELEKQLEQMSRLPQMATIAIAYDANGTLGAIAASHVQTVAWLRAAKVAIMNIGQQIDGLLLAAVEREITARVEGKQGG